MSQLKLDHHEKPGSTGWPFRTIMGLVDPGFESREAGSWMRTAEESHNRTKRPSSVSRFSMVV